MDRPHKAATPISSDNDHVGVDDVWLEPPRHFAEAGEYAEAEAALQAATAPDFNRLRTIHTTAGYREGFAAARQTTVQGGFDEGHLLGAALGIRAGYLLGVIEGMEHGLDLSEMPDEQQANLRDRLARMKQDLRLDQLLGQQWIHIDGTWKWPIPGGGKDEDEPTINTIANSHPLLHSVHRRISLCCDVLGIKRPDSV